MRVSLFVLLLAVASPAAARPAPPPQARQVERHRHHPAPRVTRRGPAPRVVRVRPAIRPVRVVYPRPVQLRPVPYVRPMDPWEFQRLLAAVRDQPFGDDRLLVIELAARDHLFSVAQVVGLLDSLTFGSEKLDALRLLAPLIVDRANRFEIVGAFTFSSERREAAALLS